MVRSYISSHGERDKWFLGESPRKNSERARMEINSNFPRGSRILDIGTGTGELVRLLREDGHESYGIDLNLRRETKGIFIANAMNLPFREGSFDIVVENMLLLDITSFQESYYFDYPGELRYVVKEVSRVLRPEGVLVTYFDLFSPIWKEFMETCTLHKRTDSLIIRKSLSPYTPSVSVQ